MKYQALKGLKTKTKVLGIFDTLQEAHQVITMAGGIFQCFSYIGGWPAYSDNKNYHYNIQGLADIGVVCSIPKQELDQFDFIGKPVEVKCICACGNEHMTQPL